ncbi:uncharacterized protein LOC135085634 isoform X2 [Ostrinia nubilalis]|uniref:uncharacterized protein LOC135084582 n=1 Tax=Ostrinia nubilalis TaxID=29057 RepID=UPI003082669A
MAEKLIKQRGSVKAKLTSFSNYMTVIKSCKQLSDLQVLELEGRFNKFESLHDEFNDLQTDIELLSDNPEEAYAERFKFEDTFYPLVAQARKLLEASQQLQNKLSAGSVSGSEVSAVVRVVSDKGQRYSARVLLDNGSTAHFVTDAVCTKLGLSRVGNSSKVTGD